MSSSAAKPPRDQRSGAALLARVLSEIDLLSPDGMGAVAPTVPLPSRLAAGDLAWASVAAAHVAAGRSPDLVDAHRVAVSYRSDRFLTIDGSAPPVWSPFSGFWRTRDGWIGTHGNYPHHARALLSGLGLRPDADADHVRTALASLTSGEGVAAITASGGLAVPVLRERPEDDRALRSMPLLDIARLSPAHSVERRTSATAEQPLRGFRVLDLTRVIAGPVCTRTLALLGADVLRIDPPHLPEPEWQHFDTGHGKRSAVLDARSSQFHDLLETADAVVLGYRPAALDRLGLDPDELAHRYPGLVVAQLSAWGTDQPERAGFDSLVQAESGIALVESPDGHTPGVLPAQALDHSAGYLLAAAVTTLLQRRTRDGGTWRVRTSLRRVAAELLGMPRTDDPAPEEAFDPSPHLTHFTVEGRDVVTARPALAGTDFAPPRRWGRDQPVW